MAEGWRASDLSATISTERLTVEGALIGWNNGALTNSGLLNARTLLLLIGAESADLRHESVDSGALRLQHFLERLELRSVGWLGNLRNAALVLAITLVAGLGLLAALVDRLLPIAVHLVVVLTWDEHRATEETAIGRLEVLVADGINDLGDLFFSEGLGITPNSAPTATVAPPAATPASIAPTSTTPLGGDLGYSANRRDASESGLDLGVADM